MAYCNNCHKDGFRKADVEYCESTKQILCHGCYSLAHPGWLPPQEIIDLSDGVPAVPKVGFAIQITDGDGVRAKLSYGGFSITVHAPAEDLRKLIGN